MIDGASLGSSVTWIDMLAVLPEVSVATTVSKLAPVTSGTLALKLPPPNVAATPLTVTLASAVSSLATPVTSTGELSTTAPSAGLRILITGGVTSGGVNVTWID